MQTIAVVNEKGGTGKTTTAVNLSAALGEIGKRVLLVDLDGQAASSRWLGVEDDCRFADALWRGEGLEFVPDVIPGVSLAPGSGKMDSVAHDLRPTQGGQLRKLLATVEGFDFAIIDCPPSLGNRLIGNALLAATHAIVPVETSILAMDGLKILLTTLQDVHDGFGHDIQLAGVLACRFDARTKLSRFILAEMKRALPGKVFETVIRENVRMRECPGSGQSILTYATDSHAAEDYRSLAKEFLTRTVQQMQMDFSHASYRAVAEMREQVESMLRKFNAKPAEELLQEQGPELNMDDPATGQQILQELNALAGKSAPAAHPQDAPAAAEAPELIAQEDEVRADTSGEIRIDSPELAPALEPAALQGEPAAEGKVADHFEEISPYAKMPTRPDLGEALVGPDELTVRLQEASLAVERNLPPTPAALQNLDSPFSPPEDVRASEVAAVRQEAATVPPEPAVETPAPAPQAQPEESIPEPPAVEALPQPIVPPVKPAREQDYPALREMLKKMNVDKPAAQPGRGKTPTPSPSKKDSPWRRMLRAVGVD